MPRLTRTHLPTQQQPSLEATLRHFRTMADFVGDTEEGRLWQQLADELEARLNEAGKTEDVPLFEMNEETST